jgi:hypothetical protein
VDADPQGLRPQAGAGRARRVHGPQLDSPALSTDPETLRRIAALEHKVDHLLRHLTGAEGGPSSVPPLPGPSDGVSPEIVELARSGNKIEAIKRYRAQTGCDLAVAKDVIDGL